jgi:type II secretory pathway pseudopilin PulG
MFALNSRLRASTIIETIVAMVIILICSGVGFSLFTGIARDVNDQLRIEAEIMVNSLAAETKLKKDYSESSFETENLTLHRSVNTYLKKSSVKILLIEAYSLSGKKICEYKELVVND